MSVIVLQKERTWRFGATGQSEDQNVDEAVRIDNLPFSISPRVFFYVKAGSITTNGTFTLSFKTAAKREGPGRFAATGTANDLALVSGELGTAAPQTKNVQLGNYGAWVIVSAAVSGSWGADDFVVGEIHIVTFDGRGGETRMRIPIGDDK